METEFNPISPYQHKQIDKGAFPGVPMVLGTGRSVLMVQSRKILVETSTRKSYQAGFYGFGLFLFRF